MKSFLVVAREENITRAADILHISQPALSRQLMQLEDELETRLFVRGKRKVTLTEEGMLLRRRATEILDLTEKTESELKNASGTIEGVIAIGTGEAKSMWTLAEIMKEFSAVYPGVKYELYSNNADFIREKLDKGLLDIGVLIEPTDLTKYDYLALGVKERAGVIVPADSPLAQKERVTPEDLIGCKVFLGKRAGVLGQTDWLGPLYEKLDVSITYNLLYNVAVLVERGMGVSFTIEGAVELYRNPRVVFKPLHPEIWYNNVFVWKKFHPLPPAVARFIEFAKSKLDGG